MKRKPYKLMLLLPALLMAGAAIAQQTAAPTPATATGGNSLLTYLLVATGAILLLAILLVGNLLVSLTKMAIEKGKTAVLVLALGLTATAAQAQQAAATAPAATGSNVFNFMGSVNLTFGVIVVGIELLTLIWLLVRVRGLLRQLSPAAETTTGWNIHLPRFFDKLNASVAIEKEHDVMLDHNYDGIRELDNSLPPWWKYSFYISIIWAVVYMAYYHMGGGGPGSIDEYNTEVEMATMQIAEYNRKNMNNVDENNVQLADASGILDGKEIFTANCAACHGAAGEGNAVGPNLTDAYWLHGGSLNHIFKSVKYGWPAKGMKSWQTDLSNSQIRNVASYIQSIQGSNPANAKEAQGELYNPAGNTAPADSLSTAANDTTAKAAN